jgi:protein-S-isoprenylcysteine O-methyltransferase Ste14
MANHTKKSAHRDRRLLPPVYFLLAVIGMLLLHFVFPGFRWLGWPWNMIGAVPIVVGLGMTVVADRQFKQHGTTVKPFQTSSVLVTDGVFCSSRNPMYLGMILSLTGVWLILGSLTPLVIVPLFAWWITVTFIRVEEQELTKQFGQSYLEYTSKVRRWL